MTRGKIIGVEAEGGQSNRLFLLLAIALVGLICIGLMGLGGVLFFTMNRQAQEEAAVLPTFTPIPPTPTPTSTISPTPTETPLPTPTSTPVIPVNGGNETPTVDPNVTPTDTGVPDAEGGTALPAPSLAPPTPIATTPPTGEMPGSGGVLPAEQGVLIWAGLGLLLLLILGVFNHFRKQSTGP